MNVLEELDLHINGIDHELEDMINNYLPIEFVNENKRLHKEKNIIVSLIRGGLHNDKYLTKLIKNTEDFVLFHKNVIEYIRGLP